MATPLLKAEVRNATGKIGCKKLRSKGFVPAVVYGHNKQTKSLLLNKSELERILNRHGSRTMINLELGGQIVPTIIKEVQKHVIKEELLHIDLQQLSENEKIKIQVPIVLKGREKVENSTTIFQQQLIELEVQCLPKDILQSVEVDISELKPGESITVGDIDIVKNTSIEVLNDHSEIIGSLTTSTKEEDDSQENNVPIYESDKSILED